jgi:uncharacterized protein (TIGR02996 family)
MASQRNPELEARLACDPEDVDAYLVYADWLSERGDPRGDLIVLQDRIQRADDVLAKHRAAFLGPLERVPKKAWTIEWDRGFVRKLRLELKAEPEGWATIVPELLAHPSFALLRSFSAVSSPIGSGATVSRTVVRASGPLTALAEAIARCAPTTLKH